MTDESKYTLPLPQKAFCSFSAGDKLEGEDIQIEFTLLPSKGDIINFQHRTAKEGVDTITAYRYLVIGVEHCTYEKRVTSYVFKLSRYFGV